MVDVFFALTGDPARNSRALRQIRTLRALGCSVSVCGIGEPGASSFPVEGVEVIYVKRPAGTGVSFFWTAARRIYEVARHHSARVYHASDLYVLPSLTLLARRRGARLAYDARERYPYVAATRGRPHVRAFWWLLEAFFVRFADAVFTVSSEIRREMARAYRIEPPVLLPNVPPLQPLPEKSSLLLDRLPAAARRPLILHQGQMRKQRGLDHLLEAFSEVRGGHLVFLGNGPFQNLLEEQVQRLDLSDRVSFLPPVPPDELIPHTASADIGVTLLEDSCRNHRYALPNKLFEYAMAGLPIVGSDLPEIGSYIRTHGAGLTVEPRDHTALAAALQRLVDDAKLRTRCGTNARRAVETFHWGHASERLTSAYRALLSPS